MKIRRDKKDALFSELVRERANWVCEACEATPKRQMLQCAHIFGRRYRSTRWHPDNAVALCVSCHRRFTDNPLEFADWVFLHVGGANHLAMRRLSQVVAKFSKADMAEIESDLKAEVGIMKQCRVNHPTMRIEFAPPGPVERLQEGAG